MKTIAPGILLILLCGCSPSSTKVRLSQNESDEAFQQKRREADARAQQTRDNRPYPEGRAGLPRNRSPEIAESIHLGQTMSEVASIMGRKGWSHTESRPKFLDRLRRMFQASRSPYKEPQDPGALDEQLPAQGRFVIWQYQGFPSTADWVVVFFASFDTAPESEPRVVARGVFRLGAF
jgi:hypothetical protein